MCGWCSGAWSRTPPRFGQYTIAPTESTALFSKHCSASLIESGAAPKFKLRSAAIALSALLDGLWVELSLSSKTFRPQEAIGICEDWVNAFVQRRVCPRMLSQKRHKS